MFSFKNANSSKHIQKHTILCPLIVSGRETNRVVAVPSSWVAGWGRLPRPSYFLVHSHDDYHSPEASPVHHHKHHLHANVRHISALTASSTWIWVLWFHLGFLHPLDPEQNLWGLSGTNFYGPDVLPVTQPMMSKHWGMQMCNAQNLVLIIISE